ncbi:UNVERIFIED_CONTAM: hypothetical protein RMT77_010897 [Armadillidium vulgare]
METERYLVCKNCRNDYTERSLPVVLECGHAFCRSCVLLKMKSSKSLCPKCQRPVKEKQWSIPNNSSTQTYLKYLRMKQKEREYLKTVYSIRNKIAEVQVSKLLAFDSAQSGNACTAGAKKSVDTNSSFAEINKSQFESNGSISICLPKTSLDNIPCPNEFLKKVYRSAEFDLSFTTCEVNDKINYGKISIQENIILFHCLDLSELPKGSFQIQFENIKKYLQPGRFHSFLKINFGDDSKIVIFEMLKKNWSEKFLKLCTGECGASFKQDFLTNYSKKDSQYSDDLDSVPIFNIFRYPALSNGNKISTDIVSSFSSHNISTQITDKVSSSYQSCLIPHFCTKTSRNTLLLNSLNNGRFYSVVRSLTTKLTKNTIGKLVYPSGLEELLKDNDTLVSKILDCGLIVNFN